MEKENQEQSNLEYNDGLGDLLREKEKLEFSWAKTIIVLCSVVFAIFIGLTFLFNVGKNILTQEQTDLNEATISQLEAFTAEADKIERENDKLIELLDAEVTRTEPAKPHTPISQPNVKSTPQMTPKSTPRYTTGKPSTPYKVIAGSFKQIDAAKAFQSELKGKGIDSFIWKKEVDNQLYYRVQVGAFQTTKEATSYKDFLDQKGLAAYVIKR